MPSPSIVLVSNAKVIEKQEYEASIKKEQEASVAIL